MPQDQSEDRDQDQARGERAHDEPAPDEQDEQQAPDADYEGSSHRVRRTWSWVALATLMVGVVVTGVGVAVLNLPTSLVGVGVLLAGAALAWWSGLLYNIRGPGTTQPVEGEDDEVEVPGSTARLEEPGPRRRARQIAERRRELVADRDQVRSNWVRWGAVVLVGAGLWLGVTQWTLYPETPEGRQGTWRAMGGAILVLTAGLRLLVAGRSLPATLLALATAPLLVLGGLLLAETARATASETASGIVVALAALITLDRRRAGPVGPAGDARRGR